MFWLNQASRASKGVAMYAACSLRSHWEAHTDPASATPCMIVSRSEACRATVCAYILIVEILAGGIPGVKHGVAAFVQFLECYHNAATCCYLVDRVYKKRFWAYIRLPGKGVCKWCHFGNGAIQNANWKNICPCFIRSSSADVIFIIGRAKKRCQAYMRLTCRPSTLKVRNTSSTAPNAIYKKTN